MTQSNGSESMQALLEELVVLAPKFFASKMIGASENDIAQVEQAAGTILSDGHRTFLRFMGGTPVQELNPLLNDRDFCTATLIRMHNFMLQEPPEPLPPGIIFFSSSDVLGENIFLKHGESPSEDPLVGDYDAKNDKFYAPSTEHLEWFLRNWVVIFRLAQRQHLVSWNSSQETYAEIVAILSNLGFQPLQGHPETTHLIRGYDCVRVFDDGSGTLAGDDLDELKRIVAILVDHVPMSFMRLHAADDRLFAPRE